MSNEDIFQTMRDLVAEQFGVEPDEVTWRPPLNTIWGRIPWTWWSW